MKTTFLAVTLLGLLVLGTHDVQAHGPSYYYSPYWDGTQYHQYVQWKIFWRPGKFELV
jgi:hypothetical protein